MPLAVSNLLAVTLALTLVSFIATLYVILRTLTPLIRPHSLSRHSRTTNQPLPNYGYTKQEKKRLRPAQRLQCWLAFIDLSSCGVWLWEVVALASGQGSSPARMAFAVCARPTILVVVSLLSYLNIIRGKVIELGRFDVIVWVPSLILITTMVALGSVSPPTMGTVWAVMMAVETALLGVCTYCFGRLLLAVFRVRRDTVRSQILRHQFVMEEKRAYGQPAQDTAVEDNGTNPPMLPSIKTNRWLISKTFLLAKASTAASTVATSLHRRSASGHRAGRPSTASENPPRPSASSFYSASRAGQRDDAPYSFLNHDPTTTARYGHFRHQSASQAELQQATSEIDLNEPTALASTGNIATRPSITFSRDARAAFPLPPQDRLGAISRMTGTSTRFSGDEPRPSMGSYMSTDSGSSDAHPSGPGSYLGAGKLFIDAHAPAANGRHAGLSRRDARKAGARMGGHLIGCVASWTLALPFLVHKMVHPAREAPLYATLLVALGIALSGPLLAAQTVLADGLWFKQDLPPLMASSSAVAFEHLESRGGTPMGMQYTGQAPASVLANAAAPAPTQGQGQVPGQGPASPTLPNSATTATTNITSNTDHTAVSRASTSSISLSSLAAFSAPSPGTFRHSEDTREAPSGLVAKALSMAVPHPKLQVLSRGNSGSHLGGSRDPSSDVEKQDEVDADWEKREARKLKSFSMTREPFNKRKSAAASELGLSTDALEEGDNHDNTTRRSVLGMKDANLVTAQILSGSKKRRTPSPTPTIGSARSIVSERRKSAPMTPVSDKLRHSATISEDGVWVKRKSEQPIDAMTAALLENLIPGVKVGRSSYQRPKRTSRVEGEAAEPSGVAQQQAAAVRVLGSTTPASSRSASSASSSSNRKHRNRQNLSLDISRNNSHFSKVDDRERVLAEAYDTIVGSASASGSEASVLTAPVKSEDAAAATQSQRHLRRRSWKSVSGAIFPLQDQGENMAVPPHDGNVTRRKVTPKLSPPKEVAEERDLDELEVPQPSAPRPSLDEDPSESMVFVEQDNVEVLSDTTSPGLLSPTSPFVMPDSPYIDTLEQEQSGERPSIILRTRPSSNILGDRSIAAGAQREDDDEVGTVSTATRVSRQLSRRGSFSSEIMLRPGSSLSNYSAMSASAAAGPPHTHSHTRSASSVSSVGFLNMLASNRNSWTASEVGNESSMVLPESLRNCEQSSTVMQSANRSQERADVPLGPILAGQVPLGARDTNRTEESKGAVAGETEKVKNKQDKSETDQHELLPLTPAIVYTPPAAGRMSQDGIGRTAIARGRPQSLLQDESAAPASPTTGRGHAGVIGGRYSTVGASTRTQGMGNLQLGLRTSRSVLSMR